MRIAEIYRSVQGEGLLTGVPSVFVRASGCNLRCWFCDTPYTSWQPEGRRHVDRRDRRRRSRSGTRRHVVVTGGEPMLFAELIPLCDRLHAIGRHVTIETAGTLYLPVVCDLMSISPKFASSAPSLEKHPHWSRRHERERHRPEVIRRLISDYTYQLKFVVDAPADLEELNGLSGGISRDRPRPGAVDAAGDRVAANLTPAVSWLRPYCEANGFVFCPRKQIEWYGPVRGT